MDGSLDDLRGLYTYPTFGQYFWPPETAVVKVSMSVAVFLTPQISCPWNAMELDSLRTLLPLLIERGQRMVAVCAPGDSVGVAQLLDSVGLSIQLSTAESEQFNLSQMGISPGFMPFKVLYDSNYTAIYMRGGDSSPESQSDFMAAARRLSRLAWEGNL
ncbi:MAG: hypothetical protein ABIE70_01255 [bacterium]